MPAMEFEPSSNLAKRITNTQKTSIFVESRVLKYNWIETEIKQLLFLTFLQISPNFLLKTSKLDDSQMGFWQQIQ